MEKINIALGKRLDEHATTCEAEQIRNCISELINSSLNVRVRIEDDGYIFDVPCEYLSLVIKTFTRKGFNVVVDGKTVHPKITPPGRSPFAF